MKVTDSLHCRSELRSCGIKARESSGGSRLHSVAFRLGIQRTCSMFTSASGMLNTPAGIVV